MAWGLRLLGRSGGHCRRLGGGGVCACARRLGPESGSFLPWLYRVAFRQATKHLKTERGRSDPSDQPEPGTSGVEADPSLCPSPTGAPATCDRLPLLLRGLLDRRCRPGNRGEPSCRTGSTASRTRGSAPPLRQCRRYACICSRRHRMNTNWSDELLTLVAWPLARPLGRCVGAHDLTPAAYSARHPPESSLLAA